MTTPYNQLRQLLTDRLPEKPKTFDNFFIEQVFDLQDVFCVMGENPDKTFTINTYGEIAEECYVGERTECVYDLTKPLADQDSETLLEIIELIR